MGIQKFGMWLGRHTAEVQGSFAVVDVTGAKPLIGILEENGVDGMFWRQGNSISV